MNHAYTNHAIKTYKQLKELASSPEEIIKWAMREAAAYNEKEQQAFVSRLVDYYSGSQLEYLIEIVKSNYKATKDDVLKNAEISNITRPVIDRLSTIYAAESDRQIVGKDSMPIENDMNLFERITEHGQYETALMSLNRLATLTGTVHMRFWIDIYGGVHFDPITRDYISVLPSKHLPKKADAVWFTESVQKNQFGTVETIISYWDDENWYRFSLSGDSNPKIIEDPDNPEQVNPYGMIPFIRLDTSGRNQYFNEINRDLVNTQDIINQQLSDYNYTMKMQAFSTPVLIGYEPTANEKLVISPGDPLTLPRSDNTEQENKFYYETPQPHLKDMREEINNKLNRIAQARGLPSSTFSSSSQQQSGLHLYLQNLALIENHNREKAFYEDFERRLFYLIRQVWNTIEPTLDSTHELKGQRFSEGSSLQITIAEPTINQTPEQRRDNWEFLLEQGLRTAIDYYELELGMTRQQAEEYFETVQNFRGARPFDQTEPPEILEGI